MPKTKKEKSKFRMATGRGWSLLRNGELFMVGDKLYNAADNTWAEIPASYVGKPWNPIDYLAAKRSSKVAALTPVPPTPAAPTTPVEEAVQRLAGSIGAPAAPVAESLFQTADDHDIPESLQDKRPYQLLDVWTNAKKYADTPKPLDSSKAQSLTVGAYACLCFEKRGVKSERMWVRINDTKAVNGSVLYMGVLDNAPKHFDAKVLRKGGSIAFNPCHVIKAIDQAGVEIQ